jgi:sarcosine oxidase subunit delta
MRDETEFAYGGEAHLSRPAQGSTDSEWTGYLFMRRNPKGLLAERWQHARGCRQWFNVVRDNVTHEIRAVYRNDESKPALDGGEDRL